MVAAASARKRDKFAGLLLIRPWDLLENVTDFHYPWLLRDRYDGVTNLASFDLPMVVMVAERDSIVPARFCKALYNALAVRRQLMVAKAARHDSWIGHVDATGGRLPVSSLH